jgi:hypothetical protein
MIAKNEARKEATATAAPTATATDIATDIATDTATATKEMKMASEAPEEAPGEEENRGGQVEPPGADAGAGAGGLMRQGSGKATANHVLSDDEVDIDTGEVVEDAQNEEEKLYKVVKAAKTAYLMGNTHFRESKYKQAKDDYAEV